MAAQEEHKANKEAEATALSQVRNETKPAKMGGDKPHKKHPKHKDGDKEDAVTTLAQKKAFTQKKVKYEGLAQRPKYNFNKTTKK